MIDPCGALAVSAMLLSRPRRKPSAHALARVAELAARGCLASVSWDDGRECVLWYEATHPASLAYFASAKQHPGALTVRQRRLVRRAMRGDL